MYHHVLIPTDGSDLSAKAVEQGLQLAKALGARVTLLSIVEPQPLVSVENVQLAGMGTDFLEIAHNEAKAVLGEAESRAEELGVAVESIVADGTDAAGSIVQAADEAGCDLIAMGSRGRSGLTALVLGSVTMRVLNESTVPVIVYR
ncbi:universal stress protein [Rhizobiaceae bacterium BDR2-2]|uniref:Universal stress protein n=1 Tax=Ectorhizobium quercum TaxID=2965071 RepID=A0AAE3MZF6_9HYPH|nr:universal stress protein [Ectorhizobium quercum]MCX8996002.1 universal stress protein [Ectorhizobium quercum]